MFQKSVDDCDVFVVFLCFFFVLKAFMGLGEGHLTELWICVTQSVGHAIRTGHSCWRRIACFVEENLTYLWGGSIFWFQLFLVCVFVCVCLYFCLRAVEFLFLLFDIQNVCHIFFILFWCLADCCLFFVFGMQLSFGCCFYSHSRPFCIMVHLVSFYVFVSLFWLCSVVRWRCRTFTVLRASSISGNSEHDGRLGCEWVTCYVQEARVSIPTSCLRQMSNLHVLLQFNWQGLSFSSWLVCCVVGWAICRFTKMRFDMGWQVRIRVVKIAWHRHIRTYGPSHAIDSALFFVWETKTTNTHVLKR